MKNAIKNIVALLQVGLMIFQIVPVAVYANDAENAFSANATPNGFELTLGENKITFALREGDFAYEMNATAYGANEVLNYGSGDIVYEINAGNLNMAVEDGALVFYKDGVKVFTRPVATLRDNADNLLGVAQYQLLEKNTTTIQNFDADSAPENRDGYKEGPDGYWYNEGVAYEYRGGTYVRVIADWNNPSGVAGEVFGERDFSEYLSEETTEVLAEEEPAVETETPTESAEIISEPVVIETPVETTEAIEENSEVTPEVTPEVAEDSAEVILEEETPAEETPTETTEAETNAVEEAVSWLWNIDSAYAQETPVENILPEETEITNPEEAIVTFEETVPTEVVPEVVTTEIPTEIPTEEITETETATEVVEVPVEKIAEDAIVAFEEATTSVTYVVKLDLNGLVPAQIILPTVVLEDQFIQDEAKNLVCINPAQYAEMFGAISGTLNESSEEYLSLDFSAESMRAGEAIIKTSERELTLPVAEVSAGGDLLAKAKDYLAEKKTELEAESDHFLVDELGEQIISSTQVADQMEESLAGTGERLNNETFFTNSDGRTLETSFNENSNTVEKAITINNNYSFDVKLRGLEGYCQSVYEGEQGDTKVYASEHDLITYVQSTNSGDTSLKEWIYALAQNSENSSRYDWDFSLTSDSNAWLEFAQQADGSVILYQVQNGRDGEALTALVKVEPLVYFTAQGVKKELQYIIDGATLSIEVNESAEAYPLLIDPTFTLVTNATGFTGRSNHSSVVFNNKMWVMGGYDGSNDLNDVWSSVDGNTWTRATASASWHTRSFQSSLVFNNKMWVIAGDYYTGSSTYMSDVWSSSDGVTWTQATASAAFGGRSGQTAVVFNNKMWIIGGRDSAGNYLSDAWYSSDGITWNRATASAGFSARSAHESVVYDNKIWVIGGYNGSTQLTDAWYSSDGITWTRATASMALGGRDSHSLVSYDNKLWLLGGYNGSFKNDVWYTTDGATWTQQTFTNPFSIRDNHTSLVFNNRIWVIAGKNTARLADSWSSILDEIAPTISNISANSATAPYGSTVRFYVNATDAGGSGLNTANAIFYLRTVGAVTWNRVNGAVMSWDAPNSRYYYDIALNDVYNTGYRAMATVYDNLGLTATRDESPTEFVISNTKAPISAGTVPADTASVNGDGSDVNFTTTAVVDVDGQAVQYLFRVATGATAETGVVCDSGWQVGTTYACNPGAGTFYWHVYTKDTIETTTPDYVYSFLNNYAPVITDNQTGDDTVRNASGTTYDVDCSDATLGIDLIQYSIGTASGLTDTAGWTDIWTGDGASYTTDWTVNTALLAQGRNYINVRCTDLGALTSTANGAFYIEWDTVAPPAPTVSGTTPTNDTTPTWSWVSGGVDGNGNYRYKLDDNDMTAGTTATTLLAYTSGVLAEGDHTLYVQERDAVGNWSAIGSYTIKVDTTAPDVTLTYSANPAPSGALTITATFTEALAGTPQIAINQPGTTDIAATNLTATADPLVWTYAYTVVDATGGTYVDGTTTVAISNAADPAGNALDTTTNPTFVIDTTDPSITLSYPANGALLPMTPDFIHFTYTDNAVDTDTIEVKIDLNGDADYGEAGEDLTSTCTILTATETLCPLANALTAGRYQIYFTISDTAGNITTLEYPFWVDNFTFKAENLAVDLGVLAPGVGQTTADDTEHTKITITTYGAGVSVNALADGQLTNGASSVAWHANDTAVAGVGSAYRVKEDALGIFGNYFNFDNAPQVASKAKLADGTYGVLKTYTFYVEHYARMGGAESGGVYEQDIAFSANLTY